MNKNIIWPLFLLTILTTCSATPEEKRGNTQIDSLRKEVIRKVGSDKVSTQLELALQIIENDRDEAQILADSALSTAKSTNNKNLEMRAYYILGRISDVTENMDQSESNYNKALTISEATDDYWYKGEILYRLGVIERTRGVEIKALEYFNASLQACRLSNNFKTMGSAYSMMGTIFRVNGLYDRAIEYIVNSMLNYEKAGFSEGNAWSAYLLGRIYSDLKLPQKALEYYQEALEIYSRQATIDGNKDGLAICYEQIGLLKLASGNFEEARQNIEYTLKIYTANKSEYGLSNSHKNLGIIAYSMGNYEIAENYLNRSLKVKTEIGDLLSLPTIYEYLGLCLIGKSRLKDGFSNLQRGLALAISNNQPRIQLNIYSELTKAYLSINDLENAISSQKKQIEIQDLILLGSANIKIEQLQTIYEINKKNAQIVELEKQNEINSLKIKQQKISQLIMITGILIAFLFSITIYWFYNKIRQKNLELKETNAAKDKFFAIIAHDLRGPTGTLASYLENLNYTFNELSPIELKDILLLLQKSAENVSVLLENLLLWAQSQLNKIEFSPVELKLTEVLQSSIKGLKQMADNKQINIKFEINNEISVFADHNMVQTIMRNLLSNAIKFTSRGGTVIIKSGSKDMNNAFISVTDCGVGIEKSALSKIFEITNTLHTNGTEGEKSTGLGLILVKDFIERNNGTIRIKSEKDIGTIVSFTLPATQSASTQKQKPARR
ncbi:MAG: tetratricopeptide repeat protein [Bacteroidetes bacterium]|nr:tetratricopeptide repeat protein [Bacteroidota bacterium]